MRASIEVVLAIRIGPLFADALLLLFLVEAGRQHAAALEQPTRVAGPTTSSSMGGAWGEHGGSRLETVRSGFFNAVERAGWGHTSLTTRGMG